MSGKTIVIVDDDEKVLEALKDILERRYPRKGIGGFEQHRPLKSRMD